MIRYKLAIVIKLSFLLRIGLHSMQSHNSDFLLTIVIETRNKVCFARFFFQILYLASISQFFITCKCEFISHKSEKKDCKLTAARKKCFIFNFLYMYFMQWCKWASISHYRHIMFMFVPVFKQSSHRLTCECFKARNSQKLKIL